MGRTIGVSIAGFALVGMCITACGSTRTVYVKATSTPSPSKSAAHVNGARKPEVTPTGLPSGMCAYNSGDGGSAQVEGTGDACSQMPPPLSADGGKPWKQVTDVSDVAGDSVACSLADATGGVLIVYDEVPSTNSPTADNTCTQFEQMGWTQTGSSSQPTPTQAVPASSPVTGTCTVDPTSTAPSGATVNVPTVTVSYTNNGSQLETVNTTRVLTYDASGRQIFNDGVVSAFTPGGPLDTGQTQTWTSDGLEDTSAASCKVWFTSTP